MNRGYIKLYRKLTDSRIFHNEGLLKVWIWCLLKANHKSGWVSIKTGHSIAEIWVESGQFIFGRESAARQLRMSPSTVWKRMVKLKNLGKCDIKSDRQYSIISITNWHIYQCDEIKGDSESNRQVTGKEQARNTNKNDKKDKNKEKDPPSSNNIPYQKIVDLYHEVLPELPRVKILTPTRKSQIKARWLSKQSLSDGTKIDSLEYWRGYFEYVSRSKFLMGQNDRNWKPDLEWLTKESKFVSVIEGKHH